MGFLEHLGELRTRLVRSIVVVSLTSCVAYFFTAELSNLVTAPYHQAFGDSLLIGTGPAEAFMLRIEIALFGGILLALPVLFYQIWAFCAPGLHESERRFLIPFVGSSTILFLLGILFCYEFVFPVAFKFFFEQYREMHLTPTVRMSEHLSMIIKSMLGFGMVFELPVLAYLLGRAGIIDHKFLINYFRHALVAIFLVGALVAPDVLSQIIMAIPLTLLYGVSIVIVRYTGKTRNAA